MGTLNLHEYFISRFYPARENFMHTKITWFTVYILTIAYMNCVFESVITSLLMSVENSPEVNSKYFSHVEWAYVKSFGQRI